MPRIVVKDDDRYVDDFFTAGWIIWIYQPRGDQVLESVFGDGLQVVVREVDRPELRKRSQVADRELRDAVPAGFEPGLF